MTGQRRIDIENNVYRIGAVLVHSGETGIILEAGMNQGDRLQTSLSDQRHNTENEPQKHKSTSSKNK